MRSIVLATLTMLAACTATAPPVATAPTAAPATATLRVHGALPRHATLTPAELEALGAEDVAWTFRDEPHVYRGLRLDRLLTELGFERGPGGAGVATHERRPGWRNVLLARGSDGFFAVFTLAELMPEMGPSRAYVVWQRDGVPLVGDEGPLRLVVPTDQRGSRSVRRLGELEVLDLRRLLPVTPAGTTPASDRPAPPGS